MSTECCVVCSKPVPEEYLLGKKSDWWVECSCSAHPGWYCDKHSPTNECFDDEECDCCNPAEEEEEDEVPEFNGDKMDNILNPDGLDWSFDKPTEGDYHTIYIIKKVEEDE